MQNIRNTLKLYGGLVIKLKNKMNRALGIKLVSSSLISVAALGVLYVILLFLISNTELKSVISRVLLFLFSGNLYYIVLDMLKVMFALAFITGAIVLLYRPVMKLINYLQTLVDSIDTLFRKDDTFVTLPEDLKPVEIQLNALKQTALRNEQAAKQAEQRKNDLVIYLAHDIKTPLTSVIGYLSLLDEAPDMPAEQKAKYIGITLEKAYRLEQLIDEFFEITRFNLQTIVLNKEKINLPFMLQQMADEFYPMLSPQGKQAAVNAPDGLTIFGDADKLSRVFNNILKNAIAYSYENSIINISAYQQDKNVVITFSNQGNPIPQDKLDTIFEKFFRLDASRSSHTGGSGLGLAIAKEIVTAHNGSISVQSTSENTIFTVILPQN